MLKKVGLMDTFFMRFTVKYDGIISKGDNECILSKQIVDNNIILLEKIINCDNDDKEEKVDFTVMLFKPYSLCC